VNYRSIIAALAAGILLAACSTPRNESENGILGLEPAGAMRSQSKGKDATLFVANAYNVTIYDAETGAFRKRINNGEPDLRSLFVTSKGEVIVGKPQASLVVIYGGADMRMLQKIKIPRPLAMATDTDGNLFVLSVHKGKSVEVFAPASSLPYNPIPVRSISSGINNAQSITVDTAGNLYVPNWGGFRGKIVSVYAPGSSTPTRTITQGVLGPWAVALDAANNVYVSNTGSVTGSGENGFVTVYDADTTKLTKTITTGIFNPHNLVFDGSGDLYVANEGGGEGGGDGDVTAYAPKSFSLIRTIKDGIRYPSIALDNKGNLFVANDYNGSSDISTVTVYSPGSDTPTQTITQDVLSPSGVSILE
jgi:sugar lactone lactonase YvrE